MDTFQATCYSITFILLLVAAYHCGCSAGINWARGEIFGGGKLREFKKPTEAEAALILADEKRNGALIDAIAQWEERFMQPPEIGYTSTPGLGMRWGVRWRCDETLPSGTIKLENATDSLAYSSLQKQPMEN